MKFATSVNLMAVTEITFRTAARALGAALHSWGYTTGVPRFIQEAIYKLGLHSSNAAATLTNQKFRNDMVRPLSE